MRYSQYALESDDRAFQYLKAFDRNQQPVAISAIDLVTGMGYYQGEAVPIAKFCFHVPEALMERVKDEIPPEFHKHILLDSVEIFDADWDRFQGPTVRL